MVYPHQRSFITLRKNKRYKKVIPHGLRAFHKVSEEVGHGQVTYVRKQIHAVSLWQFVY